MKNSVLISFGLHILVIILLLIWPSGTKRWKKASTIYPVELISLAQVMNVPSVKKEEIKTVPPIEKPKQEMVNISKTNVKKRPETKKEAPGESVQKPAKPVPVGSSGVKIDTQNFPFAYYLTILQNRIQGNWQPPYQTAAQQEVISTVVRFQVLRNGKIVNVSMEKSSGRYLFDQAAQRAVYSANPLPPLPDEFNGELLSVHIEFEGAW